MRQLAVLFGVLALSIPAAHATNFASLGYSDNTTVMNSGTDDCTWGTLYVNHDGSFEDGYAWMYGGTVAPYYGAFGEGYDLGYGCVACGAFWLTTLPGYYSGQRADLYVWAGGAGSGAPGAVLGVISGVAFANVPIWPSVGRNDVSMLIDVWGVGEFTIGYWGNWPDAQCGYYCAADLFGFGGGHPWTNIAPGIGYPTGWNDPSVVWGTGVIRSMGIGVWFVPEGCGPCCGGDPPPPPPVPARSSTWGSIKALFE
jgi:hypothetical protein